MEQVTVTVIGGGRIVYDRVTARIQVNTPKSWGGSFRAAKGTPLVTSGPPPHRAVFSLLTVDKRGGDIIITRADEQTREVHFEGDGPFGLLPKAV
jgi:hypothetical protein